jgi:hypothetical protein
MHQKDNTRSRNKKPEVVCFPSLTGLIAAHPGAERPPIHSHDLIRSNLPKLMDHPRGRLADRFFDQCKPPTSQDISSVGQPKF